MRPIPISSCPRCNQEHWTIEGESEGDYKCERCRNIINIILRRKEDGE